MKYYKRRQGYLALPFCFFVDFTTNIIGFDQPWVALLARYRNISFRIKPADIYLKVHDNPEREKE